MSIPYSNTGRTVNIHKIKGMNYSELKTNELCTKNADGVMEGTNVFATSGNLTTTSMTLTDVNDAGLIDFKHDFADNYPGGIRAMARIKTRLGGSTNGRGGQMEFHTKVDGGTLVERLRINDDGNVGIGTTIPTAKLHVDGTIRGGDTTVTSLSSSGTISGGATTVTSLSTEILGGPEQYGPIRGGVTTVTSLECSGAITAEGLTAGPVTVDSLTTVDGGITTQSLVTNLIYASTETGVIDINSPVRVRSITQTVPYHLVLGSNGNVRGGGGVFGILANNWSDLNGLFVRTQESPTTIYNGDLVNSTYWRPSISGIFQININMQFRAVNQDLLVEEYISLQKLIAGSYQSIVESNNRRYNTSVNDENARVYTNHNTISQTVYARIGDSFKISVLGNAFYNNDIWVMIEERRFKVSITKVAF